YVAGLVRLQNPNRVVLPCNRYRTVLAFSLSRPECEFSSPPLSRSVEQGFPIRSQNNHRSSASRAGVQAPVRAAKRSCSVRTLKIRKLRARAARPLQVERNLLCRYPFPSHQHRLEYSGIKIRQPPWSECGFLSL